MNTRDAYTILCLRNEVSLCLDDLTALVLNSSLAFELRLFNAEVMEQTPDFTLGLNQAKALKKLTAGVLDQYRKHIIGDVELMDYFSDARAILKGDDKTAGGKHMPIFPKIFQGKKGKEKETAEKLEREYKEVGKKLLLCEEEMAQCIENARGCAPNSTKYRDNERAYSLAKDKLTLLRKRHNQLGEILYNYDRKELIEQFSREQEALSKATKIVISDKDNQARSLAIAELSNEKINSSIESIQGFGDSLFREEEPAVSQTSSEFGAMVASSERRQDMLRDAGFAQAVSDGSGGKSASEFDSIVKNANKSSEP